MRGTFIDAPATAWLYLTTMHAADDLITTFDRQLVQAKLDALQMLRQLMHAVAALDAEDLPQVKHWPGRELRLIAAAILRTKPLAPRTSRRPDADPPPAPVDRASGPDKTPPEEPAAPDDPTPALLLRLNPTSIRARHDIRALVRDGQLPASFLTALGPRASAFIQTPAPARPP